MLLVHRLTRVGDLLMSLPLDLPTRMALYCQALTALVSVLPRALSVMPSAHPFWLSGCHTNILIQISFSRYQYRSSVYPCSGCSSPMSCLVPVTWTGIRLHGPSLWSLLGRAELEVVGALIRRETCYWIVLKYLSIFSRTHKTGSWTPSVVDPVFLSAPRSLELLVRQIQPHWKIVVDVLSTFAPGTAGPCSQLALSIINGSLDIIPVRTLNGFFAHGG